MKPITDSAMTMAVFLDYVKSGSLIDYDILVYLISKYGKSNKQIAEEIKEFTGYPNYYPKNSVMRNTKTTKPEFYGYYSDYDWVVFCWLFGRMIED
jgi:hypothetical protein